MLWNTHIYFSKNARVW